MSSLLHKKLYAINLTRSADLKNEGNNLRNTTGMGAEDAACRTPGGSDNEGLAQSYGWWPSINQDIKLINKECEGCQTKFKYAPACLFTSLGMASSLW